MASAERLQVDECEIEINATTGQPEYFSAPNHNAERPDPKALGDVPPVITWPVRFEEIVSTTKKEGITDKIIPFINDEIDRMDLPLKKLNPDTCLAIEGTRERGRSNVWGWASLTNGFGFRFYDLSGNFFNCGFQTPDKFFQTGREVRIRDFLGHIAMSENEACNLAKEAVRRFDPTVVLSGKPTIVRPALPPDVVVPRCLFIWHPGVQTVEVEVDLQTGKIKRLTVI
jgi:hypothetical protein